VITKARGLRALDATRPSDVGVLNLFVYGRHLVLDAVVTSVYRNFVLSKVSSIPGYATKQVEDRKIHADKISVHPIAIVHGVLMSSFLLMWKTGENILTASNHFLVLGIKGSKVLYNVHVPYSILRSMVHYGIDTEYCTRIILASCTRYSDVVNIVVVGAK